MNYSSYFERIHKPMRKGQLPSLTYHCFLVDLEGTSRVHNISFSLPHPFFFFEKKKKKFFKRKKKFKKIIIIINYKKEYNIKKKLKKKNVFFLKKKKNINN